MTKSFATSVRQADISGPLRAWPPSISFSSCAWSYALLHEVRLSVPGPSDSHLCRHLFCSARMAATTPSSLRPRSSGEGPPLRPATLLLLCSANCEPPPQKREGTTEAPNCL